jgi:hypothetical protein
MWSKNEILIGCKKIFQYHPMMTNEILVKNNIDLKKYLIQINIDIK